MAVIVNWPDSSTIRPEYTLLVEYKRHSREVAVDVVDDDVDVVVVDDDDKQKVI